MAPEIRPIDPGYYTWDMRRMRLGEFLRISGGAKYGNWLGCFLWLFRGCTALPPNDAYWVPVTWRDTLAAPEDICERGMEAMLPEIAELERAGFRLIHYQKTTLSLSSTPEDNAGATLLHSSGDFVATIIYQEVPEGKEILNISLSFRCISGKWVFVQNTKAHFDLRENFRVIALPDASVEILWERIQQECEVSTAQGELIAGCHTAAEWESAYDKNQAQLWHHRINVRKLYRKLTEAEVETLRHKATSQQD